MIWFMIAKLVNITQLLALMIHIIHIYNCFLVHGGHRPTNINTNMTGGSTYGDGCLLELPELRLLWKKGVPQSSSSYRTMGFSMKKHNHFRVPPWLWKTPCEIHQMRYKAPIDLCWIVTLPMNYWLIFIISNKKSKHQPIGDNTGRK